MAALIAAADARCEEVASEFVSAASVVPNSPILVTLIKATFLRNVESYKSHTA
jgi:hypothetical protein